MYSPVNPIQGVYGQNRNVQPDELRASSFETGKSGGKQKTGRAQRVENGYEKM